MRSQDAEMAEGPYGDYVLYADAQAQITQLKEQLESLKADAERYRWLCDKFSVTKLPCAIERIIDGTYVADGKRAIDEAIDTALKGDTVKG